MSRFVLCVVVAMACACGSNAQPPPAAERRIAAMAPAAAEMLDTLGALDQVVGVGDYVTEPARVRTLPRLGAYDAPNTERLLGLKVNLFVTSHSAAGKANHDRLRDLGIQVLELDTTTYDGMRGALLELGRTLGKEPEARVAEARIRARMTALTQRTAALPRRRVLFVVGRDPMYVAGAGSHIDEMITAAGGANVAADTASPYQLVSLEAMLERKPEVIVDSTGGKPDWWSQWPTLPAVAQHQVYAVAPGRLDIPGPRMPDMAEVLARVIHPEVFGAATASDLGPAP